MKFLVLYMTVVLGVAFSPNTPAGEYWTLVIYPTPAGQVFGNPIEISFLPTGDVDHEHTTPESFENASIILLPAAGFIQEYVTVDIDIFRLLNWMFISYYWIF